MSEPISSRTVDFNYHLHIYYTTYILSDDITNPTPRPLKISYFWSRNETEKCFVYFWAWRESVALLYRKWKVLIDFPMNYFFILPLLWHESWNAMNELKSETVTAWNGNSIKLTLRTMWYKYFGPSDYSVMRNDTRFGFFV